MSQSDPWRTVWCRWPPALETVEEIALTRAETVEQDPGEQSQLLEAERAAYAAASQARKTRS